MRKTQLKIKIKSLAAEATIIRMEERKLPRLRDLTPEQREDAGNVARVAERADLVEHRKGVVRNEARSALLAYGYIRGRPYPLIEEKFYEAPDVARIAEIVYRFGGYGKHKDALIKDINAWMACEEVTLAA